MREGAPAFIGRLEERPLGPARALLAPEGLDQALPLEHVERAGDKRAADRPDLPDLAAARQLLRERPAVGRAVRERAKQDHSPGARSRLAATAA